MSDNTPGFVKKGLGAVSDFYAEGVQSEIMGVDLGLRLTLGNEQVDAFYDSIGAQKDAAGAWLYDQFTPDQLHAIVGFGSVFLPALAPERSVAGAAAATDSLVLKSEIGAAVSGFADKAATLAANKANGSAFEASIYQGAKEEMPNAVQQITVQTPGGYKTRIDIMGVNSEGNVVCIECKSSLTAPLTGNQKLAFPEIEKLGELFKVVVKSHLLVGMLFRQHLYKLLGLNC
ncbi:MAG: hypothetical protein IPP74_00770 [Alphaproteobacteria bacterium]|nr:hypothetical protein [Alphaproteobacteria bacterium]